MSEFHGPAVGIDLGTSNSALAFYEATTPTVELPSVLPVAQLESPETISKQLLLPSVVYLPFAGEVPSTAARLPWQSAEQGSADYVLGRWARERAGLVPERAIVSAKSWLAHNGIDRKAPVLPWKSPLTSGKRSPVEASQLYLQHLRSAFMHACGQAQASAAELVLTVPASFDEVARKLTHEAALGAGWSSVTLLEEPLAALYAWIASKANWREELKPGDLILVCDVGGGTTDFSLVAATAVNGELKLERLSVGDHLLLGGDNMDLALAYMLKAKMADGGANVDHWQFMALVAVAQTAKEKLFTDPALDQVPIAVAGRGASLFAQSLTTSLTRREVDAVIVDGFFPRTGPEDLPKARRGLGIQELGLPYAADAAISRHLAQFLTKSRQNVESRPELCQLIAGHLDGLSPQAPLLPNLILFNGGVFNAAVLRERVLEILQSWRSKVLIRELPHASTNFDLAVATGAAYYARMRQSGEGIRIRSGTAHSYYIGLESPMPAVPGYEPPVRGLCVVPQGTQEGSEIPMGPQEFALVVGEPVEFRFFSSSARAGDQVGTSVDDAAAQLAETARLATTLPPSAGSSAGDLVPVRLEASVTEVGTLQLFLAQTSGTHKWQLEFNVRGLT